MVKNRDGGREKDGASAATTLDSCEPKVVKLTARAPRDRRLKVLAHVTCIPLILASGLTHCPDGRIRS